MSKAEIPASSVHVCPASEDTRMPSRYDVAANKTLPFVGLTASVVKESDGSETSVHVSPESRLIIGMLISAGPPLGGDTTTCLPITYSFPRFVGSGTMPVTATPGKISCQEAPPSPVRNIRPERKGNRRQHR